MPAKKIAPEINAQIVSLHLNRLATSAIVTKLGISRTTVIARLRAAGIYQPTKFFESQVQAAIRIYSEQLADGKPQKSWRVAKYLLDFNVEIVQAARIRLGVVRWVDESECAWLQLRPSEGA
jgi:hypothetical protein